MLSLFFGQDSQNRGRFQDARRNMMGILFAGMTLLALAYIFMEKGSYFPIPITLAGLLAVTGAGCCLFSYERGFFNEVNRSISPARTNKAVFTVLTGCLLVLFGSVLSVYLEIKYKFPLSFNAFDHFHYAVSLAQIFTVVLFLLCVYQVFLVLRFSIRNCPMVFYSIGAFVTVLEMNYLFADLIEPLESLYVAAITAIPAVYGLIIFYSIKRAAADSKAVNQSI